MDQNVIGDSCKTLVDVIVDLYKEMKLTPKAREIYEELSQKINIIYHESEQQTLLVKNLMSENEMLKKRLKETVGALGDVETVLQDL